MKPFGRFLAAAPDLALGVTFLATWIQPDLVGADRARLAMRLMLLEFIVVHSAGFVGYAATRHRLRIVNLAWGMGISAGYALLVGLIANATGEMWIQWSFMALTANRLATLVLPGVPDGRKAARLGLRWGVSAGLCVLWVMVTTFLPIPALGITSGALGPLPGEGGLWVEEPHRVLVAAAGYFFTQAYLDLRPPAWLANP
jgi:hypothetical protein